MGTNYYRVPSAQEMEERKIKLTKAVEKLKLTAGNIGYGFKSYDNTSNVTLNCWDEFTADTNIHLGKRSSGWKFCWNFHNNKYYSNKAELIKFIHSGRVVDEYGTEYTADEFIDMALNWCEPDGKVLNDSYRKEQRKLGIATIFDDPKYNDKVIDGLRVSVHTDFC